MNTRVISSKIKKSKLFSKLADKKYRNLYVASQVNKGIPYQLRALRAARGMTQADLAEIAGTKQTVISRIENKGAGNLSVKTLLKLAEAFDVALVVRFEPIDRLINWLDNFSPEDISFETSEAILKKLAEEDAVPGTDSATAAAATLHLKLAESPPTAIAAKARTARTYKSLPLFDRPLGVVSAADLIDDQASSVIENISTAQATDTDIFGLATNTEPIAA